MPTWGKRGNIRQLLASPLSSIVLRNQNTNDIFLKKNHYGWKVAYNFCKPLSAKKSPQKSEPLKKTLFSVNPLFLSAKKCAQTRGSTQKGALVSEQLKKGSGEWVTQKSTKKS